MKIGNRKKKKNNNTSSLIKNRLLTLKRSFSLANTIQSTTTEPLTPIPPQEDSQSNTIWTGAFVSPFMQKASMRLIGQTQNARRRKRKMRNCLTHTTKCQKGNTIWQPDKWPIIHFLFFYDFFYFILFCCLHNETPCIGWEIQKMKKQVLVLVKLGVPKRVPPKSDTMYPSFSIHFHLTHNPTLHTTITLLAVQRSPRSRP